MSHFFNPRRSFISAFVFLLAISPAAPAAPDNEAQVTMEFKTVEISDVMVKKLRLSWLFAGPKTEPQQPLQPGDLTAKAQRAMGQQKLVNSIYSTSARTMKAASVKPILDMLNRKDIDNLGSPRITTLSDREARVSSVEQKLWSGVKVGMGVEIDAMPKITANQNAIDLHVIATTLTEDRNSKLRAGAVSASQEVPNGDTLVIAGKGAGGNNLLVFATPCLIDATGNRIRP